MAGLVSLWLRAALLIASFVGLCMGIRVCFRLNPFIAPSVAAGAVIIVMMLAGMANVLKPTAYALYAAGILCLIYICAVKRVAPRWKLLLACGLFLSFLAVFYRGCYLKHIDDFTHWGIVARFLLRHDRMPVGADNITWHQSYPLGSACFLYYAAKLLGDADSILLTAQSFLIGLLFLPVLSLIQKKNKILYPIAGLLFWGIFSYTLRDRNLQVDILINAFGIAAAAGIAHYRRDLRRALLAALPSMISMIWLKNSGLFFVLCSGAILVCTARRGGMPRGKRILLGLCAIAIPILAYLLWSLRVRLNFETMGSHAISLTAYLSNFRAKGASEALEIAGKMFRALITPHYWPTITTLVLIFAAGLTLLTARRLPRHTARRIHRALLAAVGIYGIWYMMLFFNYAFSMEAEGLELAGHMRYNATGIQYITSLIFILMLLAIQRDGALSRPLLRTGGILSGCALALVFALLILPGRQCFIDGFYMSISRSAPVREALVQARQSFNLTNDGRYLFCFPSTAEEITLNMGYINRNILYEFDTMENPVLTWEISDSRWRVGNDGLPVDESEVLRYLKENMDTCDALVVLSESPELESLLEDFLNDYRGDAPVYRADT